MNFCWLFLAVFCLLYFMVCVISVGFRSAFNYVWLFAAIFFAVLFVITEAAKRGVLHVPAWAKIAFITVFVICIAYFLVLEICVISCMTSKPQKGCDYMIVLGAHVKGDVVSKALAQRLDAAYEYAADSANADCKIIVAGGQGKGENVTEAFAMKQYLVEKGIDEDRILMEDKSTDTDENIKFSTKLYISDKSKKVVIASNNFHIFRAVKLAKANGLENVYGIAAPCSEGLLLNYMVREAVGITKEIVYGNF
ncbi:MAG: YdcF family protein [Clostridia bacterium]|nr:YdcF family protein [Clostridia bacterium]